MSKLEAKAQEKEDEYGDPTRQSYQDTNIDQKDQLCFQIWDWEVGHKDWREEMGRQLLGPFKKVPTAYIQD